MIFSPAIVALLAGSALVTLMLVYSSYYGGQILQHWDLASGSERQLELERRTSLISTIISYGMGFQAFLLVLFIYAADRLAPFFTGAMCAAGSLHANAWGYPAMLLKVLNVVLAGVWLVLNHTDSSAYDYPAIKAKYRLLMLMTPLAAAETITQTAYFLGLKPNIITSCCGTLFTAEAAGAVGALLALPIDLMEWGFAGLLALTLGLGTYFYRRERGAEAFSLVSAIMFLVSVLAVISFISPYIYELPTHHCPFCLLQKEYGYIGYPMYLSLLVATVCGIGTGAIEPFKHRRSLKEAAPRIQKRLALASLVAFAVFAAISVAEIALSNLKM